MTSETMRLWNEAVRAFDEKDLEKCLELFQAMSTSTAQILYNSAVVLGLLGRHGEAVQKLTEAVEKNAYMAVAFYRRGYIYFLQNRYQEAADDFESCARLFKSSNINYTPMGLALKIFLSDVNVNSGVCCLLNGYLVKGVELLRSAQKDASGRNTSIIEKVLSEVEQFRADVTATLIPLSDVAPLFRPQKNLTEKPIDFLGKSKVIASKDAEIFPNEINSGTSYLDLSSDAPSSVPPPPNNAPPRRPSLPMKKSDLPPGYSGLVHERPEFPPPRS